MKQVWGVVSKMSGVELNEARDEVRNESNAKGKESKEQEARLRLGVKVGRGGGRWVGVKIKRERQGNMTEEERAAPFYTQVDALTSTRNRHNRSSIHLSSPVCLATQTKSANSAVLSNCQVPLSQL